MVRCSCYHMPAGLCTIVTEHGVGTHRFCSTLCSGLDRVSFPLGRTSVLGLELRTRLRFVGWITGEIVPLSVFWFFTRASQPKSVNKSVHKFWAFVQKDYKTISPLKGPQLWTVWKKSVRKWKGSWKSVLEFASHWQGKGTQNMNRLWKGSQMKKGCMFMNRFCEPIRNPFRIVGLIWKRFTTHREGLHLRKGFMNEEQDVECSVMRCCKFLAALEQTASGMLMCLQLPKWNLAPTAMDSDQAGQVGIKGGLPPAGQAQEDPCLLWWGSENKNNWIPFLLGKTKLVKEVSNETDFAFQPAWVGKCSGFVPWWTLQFACPSSSADGCLLQSQSSMQLVCSFRFYPWKWLAVQTLSKSFCQMLRKTFLHPWRPFWQSAT